MREEPQPVGEKESQLVEEEEPVEEHWLVEEGLDQFEVDMSEFQGEEADEGHLFLQLPQNLSSCTPMPVSLSGSS